MTLKRALPLLSAFALSALPTVARAQDAAARATSVQLFDEAQALMAEGKVAEACPKYAASNKLDPQLGALLLLADCYERNGQLASAWGGFREAEELAQLRGDERAAFARERATALAPRLSRLAIIVPDAVKVPGLEVRVDGTPVAAAVWGTATATDTGSHGVEARAPGYESWSSSVDVTGEAQVVRVEIPALTPKPVKEEPESKATPQAPIQLELNDTGASLRTLGWVGAGVGVVGVGLGFVFLTQKNSTLSQRDDVCPGFTDCTQEQADEIQALTDDASTSSTLSTASFIAGGALLAGGVAAILFAPKAELRSQGAWLSPMVSPQALALSGGTTW